MNTPSQRKRPLARLLALAITLAAGLVLVAQQRPKLPGEDWISMFNGTDLTGWTRIGNESWTVEDGLIHGKGLTKAYGYLETEKDYKNFQMSLRFKCVGDGNSGVFFHTGFKPGSVDTTQGMQFEIDCKMMHHTGGVYGEDGRGWVVWPSPENESVVRMGEWNDYLVEVVGNHYKSRLNGVQMVDFTDPKTKFLRRQNRIAASRRRLRQHAIQRSGSEISLTAKGSFMRPITPMEIGLVFWAEQSSQTILHQLAIFDLSAGQTRRPSQSRLPRRSR